MVTVTHYITRTYKPKGGHMSGPTVTHYLRLTKKPLAIDLLVRQGRMGLVVNLPRRTNQRTNMRLSLALTKSESDEALRSLAGRLGYEIPRTRSIKTAPILFLPDNGGVILSCSAGIRRPSVLHLGHMGVRAKVTKRRALEVLKRIAPALDWELTEE